MPTTTPSIQERPSPAAAATATVDFNRWLIPLAAVLIHICIGSIYAWSTLNRPIQAVFPSDPAWFSPPYTTFSTALVLLGLSAAVGGPWVVRRGPKAAAKAAAICFGTGLVVGGLGLYFKQSVLVFLGMGVIGGIGAGLGYIAPVTALVRWFPDRRGMATGMAIMGFGGGAFVSGYLNPYLMARIGVAMTLVVLGAVYFIVMMLGARIIRWPPNGFKPAGWTPSAVINPMIAKTSMNRNQALRTPQFYLLWGMLFLNVTAGVGILAQASPMMQDMFHKTAIESGVLISVISLFNASGRLFWASVSDYIGRRNAYLIFFIGQVCLFVAVPQLAGRGEWVLFEATLFVIFTMYGGGFATIPAFLADIFGPENVGAIHGAVLTAWSAAAVAGPVIITKLSNNAKAALSTGASRVHIYDAPLRVLAVLLAAGVILTVLVRPSAPAPQRSL